MIAVLIIITLSVILLFPLGELGMGLALAIIITLLVGVIVYSKLMKRYTNNRGNTYMAFYYQTYQRLCLWRFKPQGLSARYWITDDL